MQPEQGKSFASLTYHNHARLAGDDPALLAAVEQALAYLLPIPDAEAKLQFLLVQPKTTRLLTTTLTASARD